MAKYILIISFFLVLPKNNMNYCFAFNFEQRFTNNSAKTLLKLIILRKLLTSVKLVVVDTDTESYKNTHHFQISVVITARCLVVARSAEAQR